MKLKNINGQWLKDFKENQTMQNYYYTKNINMTMNEEFPSNWGV